MLSKRIILPLIACVLTLCSVHGQCMIDTARASKVVEVDAHILAGGSSVIQNYQHKFPQIKNMNTNTGGSFGAGFRAVFPIRRFIGFGTGIDIMLHNYNMDMTVMGNDNASMSAVFIDNRMWYMNFPLFVSLRLDVDRRVRWDIDLGMYYAYGFAGVQRQRIYRADINAMDEIVPQLENVKTGYFHSNATFINVFNRGDIGLHLATSLNFGPHLMVGGRLQIGCKNSARANGVLNPSVHNITFNGVLGYRF